MKRRNKILLGIGAALVLLITVAAIVLATFDWNRAKPWLTATVSQAIGRSVAIGGDLRVSWERDPQLRGWHAWLPGPHVVASQVTVGNAAWAKQPTFATIDRVEFDLSLLPLLAHAVSIPSVRFVAPNVNLQRLGDGRNNWTFASGEALPWRFDLGRVQFDRGQFSLVDAVRKLDIKAQLVALRQSIPFDEMMKQQEALSRREAAERVGSGGAARVEEHAQQPAATARSNGARAQQYAFGWTAEGTFQGKPVKGSGDIGGAFALKHPDRPFPLHADVRIGDTRIALIGTLIDPTDLDALDLRLWLSGTSLAQLYDIFHVTLPESPAYATEGRLLGRFAKGATKLRYENFTARVGNSDLNGNFLYETKSPRPLLSGKVESGSLQFRDLAPMIGADVTASERPDAVPQPADKVLPEQPFRPERWRMMDADVQFSGDRVFRDSQLPIHKVDTRIVMDDGVLSLKPLRFRLAYGDVDATLRLDGQHAPIKATFDLSARGMQLKHVFPQAEAMQMNLGSANASAHLAANGNSVGALLGASKGEITAVLDNGTISKALVERAGLNLPNILVTQLFGDKQVTIDCAAANLVGTAGVYEARLFLIDTDIARIEVTGNIDLGNEKLDLTVHPNSKGVRLFSLRSPIYVKGTFRQPEAGIDKRALFARGAGAVGLALLATPLAALLPLTATNLGDDGENHCASLLNDLGKTPATTRTQKNAGASTKGVSKRS